MPTMIAKVNNFIAWQKMVFDLMKSLVVAPLPRLCNSMMPR